MSSRRAARIRIARGALLGVALVPVTALAPLLIEERLETRISPALMGAAGAMMGIAIAVVEL